MAVRKLTYTFDDLTTFLSVYEEQISQGSLFMDASMVKDEVANELKLDIVLPLIGRLGPVGAQVVHRSPDGGVGLRLPEIPQDVSERFRDMFEFIAEVRDYLVNSGQYVPREQLDQMHHALQQEKARKGASAPAAAPAAQAGRGLAIPDLSGLAPTLQGTMTDRSLRDALVELAIGQVTGMLLIKDGDGQTRYGFFDKGGPVGWRTEPRNDDEVLGVLLYKAEQITKEQIAESLQIMKKSGCRQGEAFVQMGIMTFPQLIMVLAKQNEHVLKQVMQTRKGDWEFYLIAGLPERFLAPAIKVPSLLFRALYSRARKEMNANELQTYHRPNLDKYVSLEDNCKALIDDMKLQKKEREFMEVIQSNSWRLRELYSVSPLSKAITSAVVWALGEMGFLVMKDTEDAERYQARVASRISRKKAQLQGNHFEVMELHWVCLSKEVEESFLRLEQEFQPERFRDLTDKQRDDIEKIQERLKSAYAVLKEDRTRRLYRKDVVEADLIVNSAELLGKKGEMAIMRKERREACNCFAKAVELMPAESLFRDGLRRATAI